MNSSSTWYSICSTWFLDIISTSCICTADLLTIGGKQCSKIKGTAYQHPSHVISQAMKSLVNLVLQEVSARKVFLVNLLVSYPMMILWHAIHLVLHWNDE